MIGNLDVKFDVLVDKRKYEVDLNGILKINLRHLTAELAALPTQIGWVKAAMAKLKAEKRRLEKDKKDVIGNKLVCERRISRIREQLELLDAVYEGLRAKRDILPTLAVELRGGNVEKAYDVLTEYNSGVQRKLIDETEE